MSPWSWEGPRPAVEASDSEGLRVLLYERQENPILHEEYVRSARLLENESGVQESGSVTVSFDPSYQRLVFHHARVHRSGSTFERLDLSELKVIQPEPGLAGDIYTGRHTAVLFVTDLRVGDVLDYAYTLQGANPVIGDHFSSVYLVQTYRAMDRCRIRVVWPSTRELFVRQHRNNQQPQILPWMEGRQYVWDFENVAALDYEDHQPLGNEPYPYVELCDFESWSRVVDWALPLYAHAGVGRLPEARDLVAEWRSTTSSVEEAAQAALQFVQDDLRYTGLELGPDSYRPASPADTLEKRYGDCKAKSLLFCFLMRELGVEAWPALVSTSSRDALGHRLPSPFAFDHVIVKLIQDGEVIWLDPTLSSQGGSLRNRYVPPYGKALVVKPGVSELEDVPPPSPEQRLQKVTSDFFITDYDSPADYTVKTMYFGGEADNMRNFLSGSILEDVSQDYLNYYASYYPGITNPGPLEVSDDRARNRLTVVESYQISNLWEVDESSGKREASFYPDSLVGMLTEPFTRLRKMPLRISHPLRKQHSVTVRLPDHQWEFPAETNTVEDPAFRFTSSREGSASTVRFRYECETLRSEIPPAQVAAYLKNLQEMEDSLGDTLYYRGTNPRSLLVELNWLMALLAAITLGLTLVAVAWVWRRIGRAAPVVVDGDPPLLSERKLTGLGGWLVLVGIGLVVSPLLILSQVVMGWESYFSQPVWQEVAVPQGGQYHPLWGPVLVFELMGNIALMGWAALLLLLFFGKRRAFPGTYIAFQLTAVCFVLLDTACAEMIPYLADQSAANSTGDITRAVIPTIIWCTYMVKSRRVKLTFVK